MAGHVTRTALSPKTYNDLLTRLIVGYLARGIERKDVVNLANKMMRTHYVIEDEPANAPTLAS